MQVLNRAVAVNENPYQPPNEPSRTEDGEWSLDRLRQARDARRRWSRRCWLIGGLAVLTGMFAINFAQVLFAERGSRTLIALIDTICLCLIFLGVVVIVFGPISWFWLHRSR